MVVVRPRASPGARSLNRCCLGVKRLMQANRRQFLIADSSGTPWANFRAILLASTTGADTLLTAVTTVTQHNQLPRLSGRGAGVATSCAAHFFVVRQVSGHEFWPA